MIVQRGNFLLFVTLAVAAAAVTPAGGANSDAWGWDGRQRYAKRRVHPGFLRGMDQAIPRHRAAAIGPRPGDEQVTPAANFRYQRPASAGDERPARG